MNAEDFALVIEIRGLYDGWSVGVKEDGTMYNRWPEGDERHAATQRFINSYPSRYEWERKDTGDRPLFRSSEINEQEASAATVDGGLQLI